MDITVKFGKPKNVTPGGLDGVIVRFPFTVIKPGRGALKDKIEEHIIDVSISGTLYSMWGFGRFFLDHQPPDAIKTLFQFSWEKIKEKLKDDTLDEHEEVVLYTSTELKENPYDVNKIKFPTETSFIVSVQDNSPAEMTKQTTKNSTVPNVFISYSWDNDTHREWVRNLSKRLRSDGANVTLDQWDLSPGDQMTRFMETAVIENDLVLIICTPRYKKKSDLRSGGVGYEGDIMTAEVLSTQNHRKFIPILRSGLWEEAAPSWIIGKLYIDLSGDVYSENKYMDLVATVHNKRPSAPPIGTLPKQFDSNHKLSDEKSYGIENFVTIKIEGIIVDEVTLPKNDGIRGSGLYSIPFKLTHRPSSFWIRAFIDAWNSPTKFTTMHRSGIAKVEGEKIVLDGTTIEEVEKYHRDTLQLAVDQANKLESEKIKETESIRLQKEKEASVHKQNIEAISKRISF